MERYLTLPTMVEFLHYLRHTIFIILQPKGGKHLRELSLIYITVHGTISYLAHCGRVSSLFATYD